MSPKSFAMTVLPGLLLLAGCVATAQAPPPPPAEPPCRQDCSVAISLPSQAGQRPAAPDWFRVVGDEVVDFDVRANRGVDGRTILSFEEAAFVDARGNPIYTLDLQTGSNRYRVRPYEDEVCRAPQGCRYVVINVGNPGRPGIINSPRIIIDPR